MASGTWYNAKLCFGDREDNYRISKTTPGNLTVRLSVPEIFIGHMQYFLYSANDLNNDIRTCPKRGTVAQSELFVDTCPNLPAGDYIVRIYTVPDDYASSDAIYGINLTY
jgi:hypothetical protein